MSTGRTVIALAGLAALGVLVFLFADSRREQREPRGPDVAGGAQPTPPAAGEAWPAPYAWVHAGGISYDELPAALAAFPFERIELQRTLCFGACPDYTVTLWRDGKADYVGRDFAPREGRFTGQVDPYDYGRLCFLLEQQGFFELRPEYIAPRTDNPTTYLRVWRDGADEPVTVEDYGFNGPVQLWGLQQAVDSVAERIEWKPGH